MFAIYKFAILFLIITVNFIFISCDGNNTDEIAVNNQLESLLDDIIKCEMLEKQLTGLSVSIVQKGNVVYQKSFGNADIKTVTPVTSNTPFAIASMTKVFTAISMLQLIEEGKAGLDDQIGTYLPDLTNDDWKLRTIRNLLSMSSGIPELSFCSGGSKDGEICENSPPFIFNACGDGSSCESANRIPYEEYLEKVAAVPMQFEPGSEYFYSNTNFLLLGKLIEAISGKSYEEYLLDNILTPLGMSDTKPNTVPPPSITGLAIGYKHVTNSEETNLLECISFDDPPGNCSSAPPSGVNCMEIPVENLRLPDQSFSAGWLVTTQNDIVKLEKALHDLSPLLLKKETYELMWTRTKFTSGKFENFGLGWDICLEQDDNCPQPVDPLAGGSNDGTASDNAGGPNGRVVSKDGGLQGYSSVIVRYLDDGITVTFFVNTHDVAPGPLQFFPSPLAAELAKTVKENI